MIKVKYTVHFTIKNGKIKTSKVLGEEYATIAQKSVILAVKPLLRQFIKSRLNDEIQFKNCSIHVKVSHIETRHGSELVFKLS